MLFSSSGILRYFNEPYKLIVEIDPEITRYYRNFLPKSINLNKQRYEPHISVVRNEIPIELDKWGVYEGKEICFQYSNIIRHGKIYYWLEVYSQGLEDIRIELGLKLPSNYHKCFHITIGNTKGTDADGLAAVLIRQ